MAVAVGVSGPIVYREGFGYADLEQRTPADTQPAASRRPPMIRPIPSDECSRIVPSYGFAQAEREVASAGAEGE